MKNQKSPHLDELTQAVGQLLDAGIITFDKNLKTLAHCELAEKLMRLRPTIHQTLADGTDPNIWGNWKEILLTVLKSGHKADFGIVRYTRQDSLRLLHIGCIPLDDHQQNQVAGIAVFRDVTDKLKIQTETAHTERLMAIGKISGKVAHELNNPLDGILRYINLAVRVLDQNQSEKAKEYLTHCQAGLQRMVQIITEMLEFSRSANQALEDNPIDKLLEDAIRAMESALRQIDVKVIRSDTSSLPHMKSDSLFQVFCNLIKNACDAMDGMGALTITLGRRDNESFVEFADSGPGFEPVRADDLFKPFYTTKPKGRGTGLGLAICKDILEKLNGSITARNHPGGGAVFTVHLPCRPTVKQDN